MAVNLPLNVGPLHVDADGVVQITIPSAPSNKVITVYPFHQPQPYYTVETPGREMATTTTNGVRLLRQVIGSEQGPHIVQAGYELLAQLLIAPDGLTLTHLTQMNYRSPSATIAFTLEAAQFDLASGSLLVFGDDYAGRIICDPETGGQQTEWTAHDPLPQVGNWRREPPTSLQGPDAWR